MQTGTHWIWSHGHGTNHPPVKPGRSVLPDCGRSRSSRCRDRCPGAAGPAPRGRLRQRVPWNDLTPSRSLGISPAMTDTPAKPKRPQQVFTLLVEVGRKAGDGLPKDATGAALMIYASGVDEAEAVRETVAILKQADMAPLDVSGYGTLDERLAEGHDIDAEERALMARALAENSVIVAQMTPFYDKS